MSHIVPVVQDAQAKPPTAAHLLELARQYGTAACALRPDGRKAGWHPYRFCALHAIELSLSALLLHNGLDWKEVRTMRHDLSARAARCRDHSLVLSKKSAALLERLSREDIYQGARYGAAGLADNIHPNQFLALFTETVEKITILIRG